MSAKCANFAHQHFPLAQLRTIVVISATKYSYDTKSYLHTNCSYEIQKATKVKMVLLCVPTIEV